MIGFGVVVAIVEPLVTVMEGTCSRLGGRCGSISLWDTLVLLLVLTTASYSMQPKYLKPCQDQLKCKETNPCYFVFHGGSGSSENDIKVAVAAGEAYSYCLYVCTPLYVYVHAYIALHIFFSSSIRSKIWKKFLVTVL